MTIKYLSVTDVSKRLGISTAAVSAYKLPQPDALIGRTRGWLPEMERATPRTRSRRWQAAQASGGVTSAPALIRERRGGFVVGGWMLSVLDRWVALCRVQVFDRDYMVDLGSWHFFLGRVPLA